MNMETLKEKLENFPFSWKDEKELTKEFKEFIKNENIEKII